MILLISHYLFISVLLSKTKGLRDENKSGNMLKLLTIIWIENCLLEGNASKLLKSSEAT